MQHRKVTAALLAVLLAAVSSPAYAAQGEPQIEEPETIVEEIVEPQAEEELQSPEDAILDNAVLEPQDPESNALDIYVEELLDEITTDEMDTGEKVKACYDYLVDNVQYGSHMRYLATPLGDTGATCSQIYANYGEVEGFGAVALAAGIGMCNAYAGAFIVMTRALGLDSHLVEGSTGSARGGYAYHKWAEIDIDGVTYVFDPQLEQNLRKSGLAPYSVYCKTYDQISGRYIREARND